MKTQSKVRLFMDSGAPTFYNSFSRKFKTESVGTSLENRKYDNFDYVYSEKFQQYRQSYIDFLKKEASNFFVYANLDVINNAELTWQHQLLFEQNGLNPVPVFHIDADEKYLKKYVDNYEYILIGGMMGISKKVIVAMLDYLFKKYIIDDKGKPRVKVHGLAATSLPLMQRYPWYSVDSSSCLKAATYGEIYIPNPSFTKLHSLLISDRNPYILQTIPPLILKRIKVLSKIYNCPIEELISNRGVRLAWNYMVFLDVIYITRYKFTQERIIDFYYAGNISEEEEIRFWKTVSSLDTFRHFNLTRLFSYMYPKDYLNFKKNETSIIR